MISGQPSEWNFCTLYTRLDSEHRHCVDLSVVLRSHNPRQVLSLKEMCEVQEISNNRDLHCETIEPITASKASLLCLHD
jgi:hypothetical protein